MRTKLSRFSTILGVLGIFTSLLLGYVALAYTFPVSPSGTIYFPHIPRYYPSPLPTLTSTLSYPVLLITEVMLDPVESEPAGEWIELYNAGGAPLSLAGYKLGDAWNAGDGEGMFSFPKKGIILPGQAIIVANQASIFYSVYSFRPDFELKDTDPQVPEMIKYRAWAARSLELTNGGDEVLVLDGRDQRVDGLSWGTSTIAFKPAAMKPLQGHSLERVPASRDTNSAADWHDRFPPSPGSVDLTPPTATFSPTPTRTTTQTPTSPAQPSRTRTATTTVLLTPTGTITRAPSPIPSYTSTPTFTNTPVPRRLLISEVMVDPVGTEPDGEWIEIYNADSVDVNLDGYKVGDEETRGGNEGMMRFPPGATLGPGQVVVVANHADTFIMRFGFLPDFEMSESDTNVPNMIKYATWAGGIISLNNSNPHDEVLLLNEMDIVIDAFSYGASSWAFSPPVNVIPEDHSYERLPANRDTDTAEDWNDQSDPRPGQANLASPTATSTCTSSVTLTATLPSTSTRTPTFTRTLTPTRTPTASRTPTPTRTATPTPTSTVSTNNGLVINEILADPSSTQGDANGDGRIGAWEDEFVEIVNHAGSSLDLSGWSLSTTLGVRHTFPSGSVLPSDSAIIVFGGGNPTGFFGGSLVQVASTGWLILSDYGDTVALIDRDGIVISSYSYGAEGNHDESLTRDPDITGTEPLVRHSQANGSGGTLFSPGTRVDGQPFGGSQ